jgi:hypothetical protein
MFILDEVDFTQMQDFPLGELWYFLPVGYLLTVLIETPILILGLSRKVPFGERLFCGFWLTACTYPIVVLTLPSVFFDAPRWQYLAVAETFAPVAECFLFWFVFKDRFTPAELVRCFASISIANIASFGVGEVLNHFQWFGLF